MSACTDTLRHLLIDGKLDTPMPAGCKKAELIEVLGEPKESGSGRLSGKTRPWLKFDGPKQGGQTQAWLADDDTLVMLFVKEPNIAGPVSELLDSLDEPEDELESRTTDFKYFLRDQVFASKGMTLTVGKPHKGGDPVIPVAFYYPPTSAEAYVGELGGKDPWVRRFRPRR